MTLLLTHEDVQAAITMNDAIAAMEDGLSEEAAGGVRLPQRINVPAGKGWLRVGPVVMEKLWLDGVQGDEPHARPRRAVSSSPLLHREWRVEGIDGCPTSDYHSDWRDQRGCNPLLGATRSFKCRGAWFGSKPGPNSMPWLRRATSVWRAYSAQHQPTAKSSRRIAWRKA